jgi:hypothetical protein
MSAEAKHFVFVRLDHRNQWLPLWMARSMEMSLIWLHEAPTKLEGLHLNGIHRISVHIETSTHCVNTKIYHRKGIHIL